MRRASCRPPMPLRLVDRHVPAARGPARPAVQPGDQEALVQGGAEQVFRELGETRRRDAVACPGPVTHEPLGPALDARASSVPTGVASTTRRPGGPDGSSAGAAISPRPGPRDREAPGHLEGEGRPSSGIAARAANGGAGRDEQRGRAQNEAGHGGRRGKPRSGLELLHHREQRLVVGVLRERRPPDCAWPRRAAELPQHLAQVRGDLRVGPRDCRRAAGSCSASSSLPRR